MENLTLKFYLPFKRNDGDESRRLLSLNNETARLFSPYHSVGIVVGEEEIKLPVACIKPMELSEKAAEFPSTFWEDATTLNAPGAGILPGRTDKITKVEYESGIISFLWKSMDTEKVYACTIHIDLG